MRSITDRIAKVTLPSPSLLGNLWDPERSRAAYPTLDDFVADVTSIFVEEVQELQRLGCTYVQLDAPHYPLLVDPVWQAFYESRGWPLQQWLARGIEFDNAIIDAAPDVTFGFHLCRGNQGSRWLVSGSYEPIARPIFQACVRTACCSSTTTSAAATSNRSNTYATTRSSCSAWSRPRRRASRPSTGSRSGSATPPESCRSSASHSVPSAASQRLSSGMRSARTTNAANSPPSPRPRAHVGLGCSFVGLG